VVGDSVFTIAVGICVVGTSVVGTDVGGRTHPRPHSRGHATRTDSNRLHIKVF
jgi:hypothetical protein